MPSAPRTSRLKNIFRSIGPGFITGASDDDPSGILTYAQTGAQFGYRQLWTVVLSVPFMIVIQEMCGRIGLVTGKGIAGVLRKRYGKGWLLVAVSLLLTANIVNIGANLGAMASSAQLLFGLPFWTWLIFFAAVTLGLEIFIPYPTYARYLKYLTLALFAYLGAAFMVRQDWTAVLAATVVPTLSGDKEYVMNIVAIFGTTISPYLFFWQADEEVEEEVRHGKLRAMGVGTPQINKGDISTMRIDTAVGMIFSNLVSFFIILTTAATLHRAGIFTIGTAAEGAEALRPLAGPLAAVLFSAGIIGTGLLSVPVLSGSASYAVCEAMRWREGLARKWWQAKAFYGVIIIATLLGMLLNALHIPPFRLLYYTAVLNGIIAPALMFLILRLANDPKVMGKNYCNTGTSNVLGAMIATFMAVSAGVLLWNLW